MAGASPSGRAGRASPEPASSLGHTATIPDADEWDERIELAVASGCTATKGGAHNYVQNGMRVLLANLRVPIGLLRLERFARDQRLDQDALDAIHALTAKARGEQQ